MNIETRSAKFGQPEETDGLFTLQFSSDTPVKRQGFTEILDHSTPSNIDLSRLQGGAVLIDHQNSIEKMVGVIERAWIDGNKGFCSIRFGSSELAQQVRSDVEAGVVNAVSVGYTIDDFTLPKDSELLATRWSAIEVSIVACPADPTCKIIRSVEEIEKTCVTSSEWQRAFYKFQREKELLRVRSIEDAASNAPWEFASDLAKTAINDGLTAEQFRERALDMAANQPKPTNAPFVQVNRENEQQFSINKVIRSLAGDKSVDIDRELEMSRDLELKGHRSSGEGLIVPVSALVNERSFNSTRDFNVATAGGSLVGTDHRSDLFIEALRPHSIAVQLGVTMLSGLIGNVSIPKQSGVSKAHWLKLDGTSEITESAPDVGSINLQMRSLAALTPITHALLKQATPNAEMMVRNDLLRVIAQGLDAALINGTGQNNQPTGIINTTGVNTVTALDTEGKIPTYSELVDMFGMVAMANADVGSMGYVSSPDIATKLMSRFIAEGTALPIWAVAGANNGQVAGHKAMYSGSAPSKTTVFGNWADAVIGTWGSVELAVDPHYKFAHGTIGVRCIHDCDIAVRNAQSFTKLI